MMERAGNTSSGRHPAVFLNRSSSRVQFTTHTIHNTSASEGAPRRPRLMRPIYKPYNTLCISPARRKSEKWKTAPVGAPSANPSHGQTEREKLDKKKTREKRDTCWKNNPNTLLSKRKKDKKYMNKAIEYTLASMGETRHESTDMKR